MNGEQQASPGQKRNFFMLRDNMQFTGNNEENKHDKVLTPTGKKSMKNNDESDQLAANDEQNIQEHDSLDETNYQPPILVPKIMAHAGLKQGA